MVWMIPVLLISFGAWRFYVLSRIGFVETWLGAFILAICICLAIVFSTGALSCAAFC